MCIVFLLITEESDSNDSELVDIVQLAALCCLPVFFFYVVITYYKNQGRFKGPSLPPYI